MPPQVSSGPAHQVMEKEVHHVLQTMMGMDNLLVLEVGYLQKSGSGNMMQVSDGIPEASDELL